MRMKPTEREVAAITENIKKLLIKPNESIVEIQPGEPEEEVGPEGRKELFVQLDVIKGKTSKLISKTGFSYSEMRDDFEQFSDFITVVSKKYVGHISREEDSIRQWVAALQNWILSASAEW
jgi:hypothetical protein